MFVIRNTTRHLFDLGLVVATPGALALLEDCCVNPEELLSRHQSGDWGDLDEDDQQQNSYAVENGMRIMSVYTLPECREVVWVVTEYDRSVTTLLLPEEY